jgi:hypothetical protein
MTPRDDSVKKAPKEPGFAVLGTKAGTIDVRLSYKIVELFSEGLYASPNKAIEELVANSFDAGALRVQVLYSANLHDQGATIVVVDNGEGMGIPGLKQHWLIGISNKRRLGTLPRNRQQIGQFGIGKLATYVLAERLTHISKHDRKYYSTSMDYSAIERRVEREVEPQLPIRIAVRELTVGQAREALKPWSDTPAFKAAGMSLFGKSSPASWTIAIMSSLKEKVHEIKPGVLEWVLRTALPLRPDFEIWLNGKKLTPSKQNKGLIKKWQLGKDITALPKPAPKSVAPQEDKTVPNTSEYRHGLKVPNLGRITGQVEAYSDLLTGKSDAIGRSYGIFVYIRGRLINPDDGHFGISPNELRHGTFNRFRLIIHIDSLDAELRSNRESVREGPRLETARDVIRAIFNFARPFIDKYDDEEAPGAKLSRKLAASPGSLSRQPIVLLTRAVVEGKAQSRFLLIPTYKTVEENGAFLATLEERARDAATFVTGLTIDYESARDTGIAQFDTATGVIRVNAWHPFVATFHDEFSNKNSRQPLELLAMAEILSEAQLHALGVSQEKIDDFLSLRDQLLRNLANESGRQSAFAVALALQNARNSPDLLESKLCEAFTSLGYEVTPIGGKGKPDGVATALISGEDKGKPLQYAISLEAKSTEKDEKAVAAGTVKVSAVVRQRNEYQCQHALIVGRAFPTTQGEKSALAKEINEDRESSAAKGDPKTITLITIDSLAQLVRLRPVKQIGLRKLRDLFLTCRLPEESARWVEAVAKEKIPKAPYKAIVETIEGLQKKYQKLSVKYSMLMVELGHRKPPIEYETEQKLIDLCTAMAQMAPGALFASATTVELDQSTANVMSAIEAATKEYEESQ